MNIGVDISQVVYETGSSVYTRNLVKHLLEIDTVNKYKLFAGVLRRTADMKRFTSTIKSPNVKVATVALSPNLADILWNKLHIFPPEYVLGSLDVFHASDWTQPRTKAYKVTTIHDLAPILYPAETAPKIVAVHKRRLSWIKKEVQAIIAPSLATKEGLVELGFKQEKIHVIYEGVEDYFKPAKRSEIQKLKQKYSISGEYYLMVGANKRKNVERVVQAFQSLNLKDTKLVVIGRKAIDIKDSKNILFVGHVDNFERPIFYSGAIALVYPSLYEGFGLPILESFACNCPVITSNISSMAEIAAEAALTVDPLEVEDIALAMKKVTAVKASLQSKGQKRLSLFSWQKSAEETLALYEGAMK
jgi:glycosyltransferase involved in cell wall biosynthesis